MSRSIHDTRRFLYEALHGDFADPEVQDALVRTARRNLQQQRSIKHHTRQQRRRKDVQLPPLDPDGVPIAVADEGPYVHPAATAEDLRAVMRRLPPGTLDGLGAIQLCLGREERGGGARPGPRDPHTGCPGRELLPGVYVGTVAGTYVRETQAIRLFSHVYAKDAPGVLAIVLKLTALVAFVQEAAHHFDHMFRVGGSRWRMDDRDKNDTYAARVGAAHAVRCVVPYLQERYPDACAALAAWLQAHGGVALPLVALIAQRPGRDARVLRALRELAVAVAAGTPRTETRIGFARTLHHAGYHDFALAALARVLEEHPDHPGALGVRACVAACRGELGLAEHVCRGVLARAPGCTDAWEVLSRVCFAQRRWEELAACATQHLSRVPAGAEARYPGLVQRARAWLALERWAPLLEDLTALRALTLDSGAQAADVFTVLVQCRQGRWAEAHAGASRLLTRPEYASARAELAAARFESAHHLGPAHAPGRLTERQIQKLRAGGYEAWVDRLVATCGLPAPTAPARAG